MKACAYCELNLPATKEHIWPNCLIEKYKDLRTYNKRENKFYKGDPTIKDVCNNCNNVLLSKLDNYICQLYDQFFHRILMPGEYTRVEYDYDLLLRALLKISYNSARVDASEKIIKAHQNLTKFILHGGYHSKISLRLMIVTASRKVNSNTDSESLMEPNHLRCAELQYNGPLSHRFAVRLVAINCYWFYVALSYKDEPPHKWNEFFDGFSKSGIHSGLLISPSSRLIEIEKNQTTYMHPKLLGTLRHAFNN